MSKYFITAIDTDAGKTIMTGLWARYLKENGVNVITQKIAQTGCEKISDDIIKHRELMGIDLLDEDLNGTTCPYLFKYPASPHLSSAMENKSIDPQLIMDACNRLEQKYDTVLLEGVGGIMVPLSPNYLVLDFIKEQNIECVLIASSKLGSINHTLLSLESLKQNSIVIKAVIYNQFPNESIEISKSTEEYLYNYLLNNFPQTKFISIPIIDEDLSKANYVDFEGLGLD